MKLIFTERNYYNDEEDNFYNYETYYYTVIYFTYYKDKFNYETPLFEIDEYYNKYIPMDDDTDPIKYVEKQEIKINEEVYKGEFSGLWMHTITVPIESNYKQVEVDRWYGESTIDTEGIDYESVEIPLPEEYDEDDYDMLYLSDYAEDYWRHNK